MKLLVDNQLPAALANWLMAQGVDAIHVLDCGLAQASDRVLWARASSEGRIIVSKDSDFVLLAARPGDLGRLLWVRIGNCRSDALLSQLAATWPAIHAAFAGGERVVELR
ncbi:MAG TPA: DUF5615 family PIN-like protein [Vineibacter sp.]|nr:DUF5615 family PIN-like protein [Vineibacter sp.]